MSERSGRSFLYFFTSLLKSIGLLGLTFFLTPVLLKSLGARDFGVFKVLMEVHGYFSLLELGLYSSLTACLIPLLKDANQNHIDSLLTEGRRLYRRAALWTLLASAGLFPFLPYLTSWGSGPGWELYFTYGLVAFSALLIPFQPHRIYLEASNQGHKVNLIIFFQNMIFIILGVVLATRGFGLPSQGIALLASSCVGVLLLRSLSGIRIGLAKEKLEHFTTMIRRYQKPQVINDIATKICLNCDQIIIAIFLGPVVVTKVFLGQRMVLILQGQLQSVGQSTYASLGSLYYTDIEVFKKRMMEVTKIISAMGVAALVPICLLNRPFIALWVGPQYQMESNALTYLSAANAFLYGLFSFWAFIFTVLGKSSEITRMIWKQAVVNVAASLISTHYFGGIGPILGTLVSFIIVPLWSYPKLLALHFSLSQRKLSEAILFPLAFGTLPLAIYHISPWVLWPRSWIELGVFGAGIFSAYSLLLFYLLFNSTERTTFLLRLRFLCKKFLRK